jgi:two-component system chemotaxis response regulator CheY
LQEEGKSMADQDMTVQTMPNDGDQPKSVLIVDDSQVMRNMLAKFFTDNGFNVVGMAEDGVQAIELFEQLNPDIMTLDIIMPKMRGTEVLETIMARYPEAKVVMASSVSDARTVMKCLKIGAKQYILKPYDEQKVMTAIKKALEM